MRACISGAAPEGVAYLHIKLLLIRQFGGEGFFLSMRENPVCSKWVLPVKNLVSSTAHTALMCAKGEAITTVISRGICRAS